MTYSNGMRQSSLGVPATMLAEYGAVSEQVAAAMAAGALIRAEEADISVSLTGIAGPDGGSKTKPVGLVWFGLQRRGKVAHAEKLTLNGDRTEVRAQAVMHALSLVQSAI